jgi:DNA ligase-1
LLFASFAEALDKAESTASRVETAAILAEALKPLSGDDLAFAVHFLLGQLGPAYEAPPVGIGDKTAVKALALLSGAEEAAVALRMREVGDLGLLAAQAISASKQRTFSEGPLEFGHVRKQLVAISTASGKGSGERKLKLLLELLSSANPVEAKYIMRFLVGRMRIGIGEGAILEALAAVQGDRKRKPEVEAAYNRHPDIAVIARRLKEGGFEALAEVKVAPLVPLRPMLAERLKTLEEIMAKLGGRAAFDYKYDGLRMQVHYKGGEVRLFSRNLEPYTDQFPDVAALVKKSAKGPDFIVEGEGVGIDLDTGELRPFQEASRRRGRKYDLKQSAQDLPFALFLFDCMYLGGEDLTGRPYEERREAIAKAVRESDQFKRSTMKVVESAEQADAFFMQALSDGCEGVIAKSVAPDSKYRAGARGWSWIKFKRDYSAKLGDTVDLVAVGAFAGKGRRTGHYGSLLMAAYDADAGRFAAVCKLASGFDDAQLAEFDTRLKPLARHDKHPTVDSGLVPEVWLEPKVVMEVRGAELTLSPVHKAAWGKIKEGAGLALRFPRFEKYREDKSPTDATTVAELVAMYGEQYGKGAKAGPPAAP